LIRSMTGFGDASGQFDGSLYSVEVRSVNNKYLKTTVRVPERLQTLEPADDPFEGFAWFGGHHGRVF